MAPGNDRVCPEGWPTQMEQMYIPGYMQPVSGTSHEALASTVSEEADEILGQKCTAVLPAVS